MNEVVSIIFSPDEATRRLATAADSQGAASAREALKVLRRVNSAIELGMSRTQYSELLIEAKATIDEALASIPEGELRNEIALAIEAYTDAKQAWDAIVRSKGRYSDSETMIAVSGLRGLVEKYSVPTGRSKGYVNDETMIKTIWQAATTHIVRATSLIPQ